jgi:SSS family solute:Na+ symporter
LVFKLNESWDAYWGGASIPSVVCAAVAGMAVSLLTPPNTISDEQALKVLAQERQAMEMHEEPPDPEMNS